MATKRLTEMACSRLRPTPGKRVERVDGLVPGLGLRISERGVRTFSLLYRVNGKQRRLTLGRHPAMPLAEARKRARLALEQADRGHDPAGERRQRPERDTVRAVAAQYLDLHQKRNAMRRADDVRRMLNSAVLPVLGDRAIASVTKRDVLDLVDAIAARAPVMANRTLSLLKRLFSWSVERGILEVSPVATMKPPARERSRERVLTDPELAAVWRASAALQWPACPITRLLVLTGARRAEVCGMAWAEIDLDRGVWTKPAARVKAGREHVLPLSGAAVELIRELPRIEGSDLVFPSRTGKPFSGLSDPKARLDELSGVTGWTHHDIRRTVASGLAALGVADLVVAAVLDHARSGLIGVGARYNRHRFEAEQRAALERWAHHVARLEVGERKIVPIHA